MKRLMVLFLLALISGCASFYSNVNHSELLSRYHAEFRRDNDRLFVHIKEVGGLNIYEIDHRIAGDKLILSGHRISSGAEGPRTFSIQIPPTVQQINWRNVDATDTVIVMSQKD